MRQSPLAGIADVIHGSFTMTTVSIRDMRLSFPKVEALLRAGEEVWIAKRGKPFARIVPDTPKPAKKPDWKKRFGPDGEKPALIPGLRPVTTFIQERDHER